jgi:hypothetical protein
MINAEEFSRRLQDIDEAFRKKTGTPAEVVRGLGFVNPTRALRPLDAGVWLLITDPEVIEFARATWVYPDYEDDRDIHPSEKNTICVFLPYQ